MVPAYGSLILYEDLGAGVAIMNTGFPHAQLVGDPGLRLPTRGAQETLLLGVSSTWSRHEKTPWQSHRWPGGISYEQVVAYLNETRVPGVSSF